MIRILKADETRADEILDRSSAVTDVSGTVSEIIRAVRERGYDIFGVELYRRCDDAQLGCMFGVEFGQRAVRLTARGYDVVESAARRGERVDGADEVEFVFVFGAKDFVDV